MKNFAFIALGLALLASNGRAIEPLNCPATPNDIHCKPLSGNASYGTVGQGPVFSTNSGDFMRGGYVTPDGKTLIAALETTLNNDQFGALVAVDLATGDRSVISGYLNPMTSRGKGVAYQAQNGNRYDLYNLNDAYDVVPLPGGDYAVSNSLQVIRVSGATGDRTLLWTAALANDPTVRDTLESKFYDPPKTTGTTTTASGPSAPNVSVSTPIGTVNVGGLLGGLLGGAKPAQPAPAPAPAASTFRSYFCPAVQPGKFTLAGGYLESDNAGNLYFLGKNNPIGTGLALYKLDAADDYRCKVVSQFDVDGTNVVGSGIPWTGGMTSSGPQFGDFAKIGSRLYASGGPNPAFIVVSVDMNSGERSLVAGQTGDGYNPVWRRGTGDALIGRALVYSGGTLYVTQEQTEAVPFSVVKIDPATGNRTTILPAKGSSLEVAGKSRGISLYAIPGSQNLLVWFGGALHVFNPNTGLSSIISR